MSKFTTIVALLIISVYIYIYIYIYAYMQNKKLIISSGRMASPASHYSNVIVYLVSLMVNTLITATFTCDRVLFPYMVICVTFLIFG